MVQSLAILRWKRDEPGRFVSGQEESRQRSCHGCKNGTFLEAFFSKGRMRPLLEAMPVKVILNDRAGLYGPVLHA